MTRRKKKIILILSAMLVGIAVLFSLIIAVILGPWRTFFWNLPSMLGFLGPRTYLVLLQNNSELRPTGGFISAVAEVNLLFGIPSVEIRDSYQVPDPTPRLPAPEPFDYFIGSRDPFFGGWTFRDSNFSPDFPTSARAGIDLYQQAFPDTDIDGVIAVDFHVIEALLNLTGPLTVDGTVFTADNFFLESQRLSKNIDTHNTDALDTRKQIMKPFVEALKTELIDSPTRYRAMLSLLFELAQKKHLLLNARSVGIQQKIDTLGFSGRLAPPLNGNDVLAVNVANIGGRKADRYVLKEARYRVQASSAPSIGATDETPPLNAFLELHFEHLGSYNIQSDIYQAFVRMFVPKDSLLKNSSGTFLRSTVQSEELGFKVFADYVRLKPGERTTLSYEYELPKEITLDNYELFVIKQPGADGMPFRFSIQAPNDAGLSNAEDRRRGVTPLSIRENVGLSIGSITDDLHFQVREKTDRQGPVVLWQEFKSLTLINVRFNEALELAKVKDPANYRIIDLNQKSASVTDTVEVIEARFEDRDLWLTVKGVTRQEEEQYQLIMRDLTDDAGNVITPNPMIRTLVQRIKEPLKSTSSRVNGDKLARHFALFLALGLSEMPAQRIA